MAESPSGSALWLRSFHPSPDAETRLICLPHAVGSASSFFWLSHALSPEIEVLSVQYPGRQDRHREHPIGDIHELADRVLGALEGSLDRPFAFFGHSMGALIAFETALRLAQRAGRRPLRLFASSRSAPSRRGGEVLDFDDDASLIARLRKLGGTNEQFLADPELLATVLPVARADYRAVETYAGAPTHRWTARSRHWSATATRRPRSTTPPRGRGTRRRRSSSVSSPVATSSLTPTRRRWPM
nr:alpha/beta fold hydrolase [Allosalinactinospora lopnorensis]